jgi:transposase InsO family protein
VETTRQNKRATAAPDLVDRHFSAVEPNRLWVADLTYIKTLHGILYLAVVVDVFSRKVVGWQMADDHRLGADCLRDGIVAPRGGPGPAAIRVPNTPRCGSLNASPTPASRPPPISRGQL